MEEVTPSPLPEPKPPFQGDSPMDAVNPKQRKPNQKIIHDPNLNPKDFNVDRVEPIDQDTPKQQQHKKREEKKEHIEEAGEHYESLAKAADRAHQILEKNNSPYRFCIFKKDEKVFIDLILLGPDGKVKEEIQKDITHEEFSNWVQHIMNQEGLLFDQKG